MTAATERPGREPDLAALAQSAPVHFVGVCGAGMSALAELLVRGGGRVSGCDANPGIVGEALRHLGVDVQEGHDPAHVRGTAAVVATSAIPPQHPELVAARRAGIPVLKRAQALGAVVNRGIVVAIAGTHGKTTATAMATSILVRAGMDPTGFVGGRVPEWGGGLRVGGGNLFVVEADEYDRSFLSLRPGIAVVTAVEADHLDIYGSIDAVEEAFREFVGRVPEEGLVTACVDDRGARQLLSGLDERALGYGLDPSASLRAVDVEMRGRGARFVVVERGERLGETSLGVPGLHNVRNALGAIAAARHLGADFDAVRSALTDFHGVGRRFQLVGDAQGVTVVDDYAHHPTEIEATLAAARTAYPDRRLVAVFQPHLYSRTRDFVREFARALGAADVVYVTDVYAAREVPIPGVTGEIVAREVPGAEVTYHAALDGLADRLAEVLRPGDVCVTMGAGNIDAVSHAVFARLRERDR